MRKLPKQPQILRLAALAQENGLRRVHGIPGLQLQETWGTLGLCLGKKGKCTNNPRPPKATLLHRPDIDTERMELHGIERCGIASARRLQQRLRVAALQPWATQL